MAATPVTATATTAAPKPATAKPAKDYTDPYFLRGYHGHFPMYSFCLLHPDDPHALQEQLSRNILHSFDLLTKLCAQDAAYASTVTYESHLLELEAVCDLYLESFPGLGPEDRVFSVCRSVLDSVRNCEREDMELWNERLKHAHGALKDWLAKMEKAMVGYDRVCFDSEKREEEAQLKTSGKGKEEEDSGKGRKKQRVLNDYFGKRKFTAEEVRNSQLEREWRAGAGRAVVRQRSIKEFFA